MAPLGVSRQVILAGGKKSGLSAASAGESAEQILEDLPNSTDGVYWIDLPTVGPTQV